LLGCILGASIGFASRRTLSAPVPVAFTNFHARIRNSSADSSSRTVAAASFPFLSRSNSATRA
jgi:hypothetical protein